MTAPGGPDGASCTSDRGRGLAVARSFRPAARIRLWRRLVRVGIEVRVVVGRGLLLVAAVAALGVVIRGRLGARPGTRGVGVDPLAVGVLGVVLAALARVVAEERLALERLGGLLEVAAVLAHGLLHVFAPDVGRVGAAVDVA